MKALFYCTRAFRFFVTSLAKPRQSLQRLRAQTAGFSLVELMIVVAIIGVLTAIAIPNFQAFQRRSRQSEAKAALTSIYTAEQTFHSSWEVYTGSLEPAGYTPSGEYRYQIGFIAAQAGFCGRHAIMVGNTIMCGPAPGREYTGEEGNSILTNIDTYCGTVGAAMNDCQKNFTSDVAGKLKLATPNPSSTSANETLEALQMGETVSDVDVNEFTAGAVGDLLGEGNDDTYDTWLITQEKELTNANNGLGL